VLSRTSSSRACAERAAVLQRSKRRQGHARLVGIPRTCFNLLHQWQTQQVPILRRWPPESSDPYKGSTSAALNPSARCQAFASSAQPTLITSCPEPRGHELLQPLASRQVVTTMSWNACRLQPWERRDPHRAPLKDVLWHRIGPVSSNAAAIPYQLLIVHECSLFNDRAWDFVCDASPFCKKSPAALLCLIGCRPAR
jgi:hypothetical protein